MSALVMVALGGGRVVLIKTAGLERESVGWAFFYPAFILGLRAFLDFQHLSWAPAVGFGLALGAFLAWISLRFLIEDSFDDRVFVPVAIACLVYGWGLAVQVNGVSSRVEFVRTDVGLKSDSGGREPSYFLSLARPRYPGVPARVEVSRALFDAVPDPAREPSEVCILVHHGVFGWRWWEVGFCP